ncbi:macro domain-containing protein [Sulfurimonas hydrogeniphila]|uniref:macro domain-containing protein n=1 Tax=Sulfurimonas hydrogeniphila TaxID=2509341 RepID=UPI00125FF972|nr:macro domain-containing protein [Sulfurimonas hydrogeniphila]
MPYSIVVKQGNLLNEEADFIVNASNTKLILGSGVSMAFKRHCGIELQNEMSSVLISIDSDLEQGDVVATSSGKANNFKYSLHVAIMNYNQGVKYNKKNPTIEIIKKALQNIENYLLWYAKNKSNSMKLVLPLMGCGVGGLDKTDVIKLYKNFFYRDVAFECEVIIYGYNIEDYKKICKIMRIEDNGI